MKKKLLVTLGCSMTEGVGCYDMSKNPDKKKYFHLTPSEQEYQVNQFHSHGWPNRVGKKLGFDKVINLGLGGSANSSHAKVFIERIVDNLEHNQFDIFVIWLQTAPTRLSFYDGNEVRSFIPSSGDHIATIEGAYLRGIKDFELGSLNEQVFYSKVIEQVCENNNFKLIHIYWSNTCKELVQIYNSKYNLFNPSYSVIRGVNTKDRQFLSEVCDHPNHEGYELIANNIVTGIKEFKPEFVVGSPKNEIEWEWNGSPIFPELSIPGWEGWANFDKERVRSLI